MDDHVVAVALKAALAGIEPDEPMARSLVRLLAEMRQARADVSDELWTDGLKVVRKSVDTHSAMKPGDRDYLAFVSAFTA